MEVTEELTVWQPTALPTSTQTQRLLLSGLAFAVAMVFLVLGVAAVSSKIYSTGFGPRSAAEQALHATQGELELTKLRLQRSERLFRYLARYGISADLATLIHDRALHEGIDPELAFRLVWTESRFNPRAVSSVGAIGLAQVMPETARHFYPGITPAELFEPAKNLEIGFRHLAELLSRYGPDSDMALLAYNRGPVRVQELLHAGIDPRNGYASHIMDGYHEAVIRRNEEQF